MWRDDQNQARMVREADGSLKHLFIIPMQSGETRKEYLPVKLESGAYKPDLERWPSNYQTWWGWNQSKLQPTLQSRYNAYQSAFTKLEPSDALYGRYDIGSDGQKRYNMYFKKGDLYVPVTFGTNGGFVASPSWADTSSDLDIDTQGKAHYGAVYREGEKSGAGARWQKLVGRLNSEYKDLAPKVIASTTAPPSDSSPALTDDGEDKQDHIPSGARSAGNPRATGAAHRKLAEKFNKDFDKAGLDQLKGPLRNRVTIFTAACEPESGNANDVKKTNFYFETPTEKGARPRVTVREGASLSMEEMFSYPDSKRGPIALDVNEKGTFVDSDEAKGEFKISKDGQLMFKGSLNVGADNKREVTCSLEPAKEQPKTDDKLLDAKKGLAQFKLKDIKEKDFEEFKKKHPEEYKKLLPHVKTLLGLKESTPITLDKQGNVWEGEPPTKDSKLLGVLDRQHLSDVDLKVNDKDTSGALRYEDYQREEARTDIYQALRGDADPFASDDAKTALLEKMKLATAGYEKNVTSIERGKDNHVGEVLLKGPDGAELGYARPARGGVLSSDGSMQFDWKDPIKETDGRELPTLASEVGFELSQTPEDGTVLKVPGLDINHFWTRVTKGKPAGKFTKFSADKKTNGDVVLEASTSNGELATFTVKPDQTLEYSSSVEGKPAEKIKTASLSHPTATALRRLMQDEKVEPVSANYDPKKGQITLAQGKGNSATTKTFDLKLPEGMTIRAVADKIMLSDTKGGRFQGGSWFNDSAEVLLDAKDVLKDDGHVKYSLMGNGTSSMSSVGGNLQEVVDYWMNDLRASDIQRARRSGNKDPVTRDGFRVLKSTSGGSELFVRKTPTGKMEYLPGTAWSRYAKIRELKDGDLQIQNNGQTHIVVLDGNGGYRVIAPEELK